jgi:phage virion morphogenesis protein
MTDDLDALEDWAGALLTRLQPAERRRLTRAVATALRRNQQQRIAAQRNPDGSAYEPRKPQKDLRGKTGRVRRKMFTKLRTAKYLRTQADADSAGVAFVGRVGRLAGVHQRGETDEVMKGGPKVRYPARQLLGFTEQDTEMIRDALLSHLAP